MRKLILAGVICLSVELLLAASGKYEPLNVKTGLWETTWISSMSGRPPIPQEMLDKMTPEQRARFETMMSRMASDAPKPRISKSCLTKEKLERDPFNKDQSCTETVLASTGSKMEVRESCTHENVKMNVLVHIEAADSEHVTGTMKTDATGGGNTMNVNGKFASKWLGPACGDVK